MYKYDMSYTMDEGRGQIIHFRQLKFTPGCVQRHYLKFNIMSPVSREWRVRGGFTLCMVPDPDSESTKLLDHLMTTAQEGREPQKINNCRKVLFHITFQKNRFCIACYESDTLKKRITIFQSPVGM